MCLVNTSDVRLKAMYMPGKPSADDAIGEIHVVDDCEAVASWAEFSRRFRDGGAPLHSPWDEVFGPLRTGAVDDLVVVGQIGQSLDGRIATASGHSRYINGPAGLTHLHRLRSLVDAVLVGVGTALADDPQLTVRHVAGPHPVRVVLDPKGRLPGCAKVFTCDGVRRLVVTAEGTRCAVTRDVEMLALPASDGRIAPRAILAALAERGLRRVLIEGGAETVSCFLAAGCLDRLHVTIAPIIIGSGRSGFVLSPIERPDQALRVSMRSYRLDDEILLDCDLSARRVVVGRAKKST
jgi:diaminohydroxyphosphoribosylaminopyrimidine deaminase/5-amino-6-(5-phosphoribosylamino)uracil reductase